VPLTIRACRLDECARVRELWPGAETIPRPTDAASDTKDL
jgi:hypothetical protein